MTKANSEGVRPNIARGGLKASWKIAAAIGAALCLGQSDAAHAESATMKSIKERGTLHCQVASPTPGFFALSSDGHWQGFFVDFCRAIAVAVLDNPDAVEFKPVPTSARFTTLQSGESDVIMDGATWTATRDVTLGLTFPAVMFYDGQGFMVPAKSGLKSAADLDGASICVQAGGATTQQNISDYFRSIGKQYQLVTTDDSTVMAETYLNGGCDAMVNDKSSLAGRMASFSDPADHRILPETISKEPLAPMVRADDPEWAALVRWVVIGLIDAEELGVTSANIEEKKAAGDPQVLRLLGQEGEIGPGMGVSKDFMARIIGRLGNYGEMYDRNLGPKTAVNLARDGSLNDLWTRGGLMYGYPFN